MNDGLTQLAKTWGAAAWIAFIASGVLALPILKLLVRLRSRQTISQFVPEHAQKQGTPTMGGLIVVAGVAAGAIALSAMGEINQGHLPMLLCFFGFASVGFLDDFLVPRMLPGKRGLGWKQKLGLELLIAIIATALSDPLNNTTFALYVFLILFYSNAFNFVDGMDGKAGGVGIVMLLGLIVMNPLKGGELWYAPIIVASIVPFLMLNAPPAKVFMGDIGSLPIGAAMGLMVATLLMARVQPPEPEPFRWNLCLAIFIASIVMLVELVPVPLQILSVKLRKKRLFLMTPIHHAFQKQGIPETRIVWGYILAQFVCSSLAWSMLAWTSYPGESVRFWTSG